MGTPRPNSLVVEGQDDKHAIVHLVRHHTEWDESDRPVEVAVAGSWEEVLNADALSTRLKASGLKRIGIVVDANDSFPKRWNAIRAFSKSRFPAVPADMPKEGLILVNEEGLRFGAWIMPDNGSAGALENFCTLMVPDQTDKLWKFAIETADNASNMGAPFKKVHRDKAIMHTWLAWQDPPGERIGSAIRDKVLNAHTAQCEPFVAWFKALYELK